MLQPQVAPADWEYALQLVWQLALKKTWLREECGWIVYNILQRSPEYLRGKAFAKTAIDSLCASKIALTPEGVAIWLAVRQLYPDTQLPSRPWHGRDPLHAKNSVELARVMRESSAESDKNQGEDEQKVTQRSNWNAKPHFAWTVILQHLYRPSSERKRLTFDSFWLQIVDGKCDHWMAIFPAILSALFRKANLAIESLLSASASQERKHWALTLFCQTVSEAPAEQLSVLFAKNMVRCLINHLSDKERYLHRAAARCVKAIQGRVEREPDCAYDIIVCLVTGNGMPNFDHFTKTKTVATILSMASISALKRLVPVFEKHIRRPDSADDKSAEAHRRAFADLLVLVVQSIQPDAENDLVRSILVTLATFAYVAVDGSDNAVAAPQLSLSSREYFRTRLSSCFGRFLSSTNESNLHWPLTVISHLKSEDKAGHLAMEFDGAVQKVMKSAWRRLNRLERKVCRNTAPFRSSGRECL